MNDIAKKDRIDFFESCINNFTSNLLASTSKELKIDLNQVIYSEDKRKTSELIVNNYEIIVEDIIKEIIQENEDDLIDIYKILSASEYAVMVEGVYVVQQDILKTNLLNAHFAFFSAINFLCNWNGYKPYMNPIDRIKEFLENKNLEDREDSMSIQDEHIAIIALSANGANIPIFSNASWWRAICHNFTLINPKS